MANRILSSFTLALALAAGLNLCMQSAHAQTADDSQPATGITGPLYNGPYVSVLGRYIRTDKHSILDHAFGGTLVGGYRDGAFALELEGSVAARHSTTLFGGGVNGLFFPLENFLPGLFVIGGVGIINDNDYPYSYTQSTGGLFPTQETIAGKKTFPEFTASGGLGYILPLQFGDYQFGIRAQGRYQYGRRLGHSSFDDLNIPSNFHDVVVDVGLQLPFGSVQPPPKPEAEPVKVVPVADTDQDTVTDDHDKCPGTPYGTKVDSTGCPLPPPCKTPAPGERISLAGCGTGDVIVLRGVNFQFNKAKLTVNAKTLLGDVAAELKKYPDITVEVGGYTDSKGSDAYNKKLSQRRADAVKAYFLTQGIAADRMTDVGYGEANPVADNGTDEGRALNRRVELKITGSGQSGATSSQQPAPAAAPSDTAEAPAAAPGAEAPATASSSEAPAAPASSGTQ